MIDGARRFLPLFVIVVAAAMFVSDYPLGWSFWFDHPFAAAFLAGVVLLVLTLSAVDVALRRREARRWVNVGRGAAWSMNVVFWFTGVSLYQMVGIGGDSSLGANIELSLARARARASTLIPTRSTPQENMRVWVEYGEPATVDLLLKRLPILLADREWRDHAIFTLAAVGREQEATFGRWISVLGTAGDGEGFRRVGRSINMLDRVEALSQQLVLIQEAETAGRPFGKAESIQAHADAIAHWRELAQTCFREQLFWEERYAEDSTVDTSQYPITLYTADSPTAHDDVEPLRHPPPQTSEPQPDRQ